MLAFKQDVRGTYERLAELVIRLPFNYPDKKRFIVSEITNFRASQGATYVDHSVTANVVLYSEREVLD